MKDTKRDVESVLMKQQTKHSEKIQQKSDVYLDFVSNLVQRTRHVPIIDDLRGCILHGSVV